MQAPSILVNTELAIDENISGFSKEVLQEKFHHFEPCFCKQLFFIFFFAEQLTKMESAVKTMHGLASDQAAKYRGDMKKVVMMMTTTTMTTVMLLMRMMTTTVTTTIIVDDDDHKQ